MKPLQDLNVVVTGSLKKMSRKEVFSVIEENGGFPRKKISGKTNLLVVGDTPWKTEKLSFANEHWIINVITENEFYDLIGVQ